MCDHRCLAAWYSAPSMTLGQIDWNDYGGHLHKVLILEHGPQLMLRHTKQQSDCASPSMLPDPLYLTRHASEQHLEADHHQRDPLPFPPSRAATSTISKMPSSSEMSTSAFFCATASHSTTSRKCCHHRLQSIAANLL